MEENVIIEAKRLHEKYGCLAEDVANEIKSYDQPDFYFWDCVIDEIRAL